MTLDEVDTTLYHICLIVINLLRPPNTDNAMKSTSPVFVQIYEKKPLKTSSKNTIKSHCYLWSD